MNGVWATGTAKAEFDAGQAAGVRQLASYAGTAVTIADADVAAYATANPYPSGDLAAKMNVIHTEIWLITGSTLNHIEGWSNWRRTGYPVLTPVNYIGNETNGQIPPVCGIRRANPALTRTFRRPSHARGRICLPPAIWWDKQ